MIDQGKLVAAKSLPMERGQAESLMPLLEELLTEAGGKSFSDITLIACGTGPGNFTGTRISVAAARGLALALGIKAVGVSLLEAAAHNRPLPCLVALDARRGESYVQRFGEGAVGPALLAADQPLPSEGTACRIGTAEAFRADPLAQPLPAPEALCEAMAEIASLRANDDAALRPAPLYLRAADAAPPREPPPVILP